MIITYREQLNYEVAECHVAKSSTADHILMAMARATIGFEKKHGKPPTIILVSHHDQATLEAAKAGKLKLPPIYAVQHLPRRYVLAGLPTEEVAKESAQAA